MTYIYLVKQGTGRRAHAVCRYADAYNIYVRPRCASERIMASPIQFLTERLRLAVNIAQSPVDRIWNRSFLDYTITAHKEPRLRVAVKSVGRSHDKLQDRFP